MNYGRTVTTRRLALEAVRARDRGKCTHFDGGTVE